MLKKMGKLKDVTCSKHFLVACMLFSIPLLCAGYWIGNGHRQKSQANDQVIGNEMILPDLLAIICL
jgi:hypothetical protein